MCDGDRCRAPGTRQCLVTTTLRAFASGRLSRTLRSRSLSGPAGRPRPSYGLRVVLPSSLFPRFAGSLGRLLLVSLYLCIVFYPCIVSLCIVFYPCTVSLYCMYVLSCVPPPFPAKMNALACLCTLCWVRRCGRFAPSEFDLPSRTCSPLRFCRYGLLNCSLACRVPLPSSGLAVECPSFRVRVPAHLDSRFAGDSRF